MAIPSLVQASALVLLFVVVSAVSHLLSLAGAVQLLRRRRSAIPLLLVVFVLYVGAQLYLSASPAKWDLFTICLIAVSGSTIGYAARLKRKGLLT
jgi:predicted tellurium resistance membrane protein TerC